MKKTARKIHKIAVWVMNWICGMAFMLSLCMVSFESLWAFVIMIGSGLWLAGYCVIHDRKLEQRKGGKNYARSR